jgi:hypothetical protein
MHRALLVADQDVSQPLFINASYRSMTAPPGNPKMVSTPSSFRMSIKICAPVRSMVRSIHVPVRQRWFTRAARRSCLAAPIPMRGIPLWIYSTTAPPAADPTAAA